MSNEEPRNATRETLHQEALAWVQKNGVEVRWETLNEDLCCVVSLRGQEGQQPVRGSDEAARKDALIHAVDELQNALPPPVEGP